MLFTSSRRDAEAVTERRREVVRGVTADRQARADLRPVGGEGRDDHVATRSDRASQRLDVPLSILLADEEVEYGAVVPQLVSPIRLPREEIRPDAPHGRVGGQPSSGRVERRPRDVEHRDVREAALHELVGEKCSSPADIDHGRVGRDP